MRYFFGLSQTDFPSYADDNTPYVEANNIDEVITVLQNDSIQLFKSFSDNQIKANKDKYRLVISNNKVSMKTDNIELENTSSEKLLSITIDSKFDFKEHLEGIIKKASWKVNVLSRITPYMDLTNQRKNDFRLHIQDFNYYNILNPRLWNVI